MAAIPGCRRIKVWCKMSNQVLNPALIRLAGDVYALAYGETTGVYSKLFIKTYNIPAGGTSIALIREDRYMPGVASQNPFADCLLKVSAGRYLLLQYGYAGLSRLAATVVDISDDGLTIGDGGLLITPVSQVEIATGQDSVSSLIPLGGAGTVTVINDMVHDAYVSGAINNSICPVAGTVYAIAYNGAGGQGTVKTINISNTGVIGAGPSFRSTAGKWRPRSLPLTRCATSAT